MNEEKQLVFAVAAALLYAKMSSGTPDGMALADRIKWAVGAANLLIQTVKES